jgi:hypothetical protein
MGTEAIFSPKKGTEAIFIVVKWAVKRPERKSPPSPSSSSLKNRLQGFICAVD